MNEVKFWRLIDLIDIAALDKGDEDAAIEPLYRVMLEISEEELFEFEEALALQLFAIDGEVFAQTAGEAGSSDDGFLYARCYVVAKGRQFFETVKADPARMPNSIDQWCESLLYPHRKAWGHAKGCSPAEWPFSPSVSYESGSNQDLWSS